MDFECHDDNNDGQPPRDDGSDKIEISWLTIVLLAAVIAAVALAIYLTRDMPIVPPP